MRRLAAIAALWAAIPLADVRGSELRLAAPRAGCLLDDDGQLRLLLGLPGGFLPGPPVRSGVLSAACGDGFLLVKTADTLEWLEPGGALIRSWNVPGGPALFAWAPDGSRALVHLPSSSEWLLVTAGELRPVPLNWGERHGEVLAVAFGEPEQVAAVVRSAERLWLLQARLSDGVITEQDELAEASAPILLLDDGAILWGAGEGLLMETRTGIRRRIPMPAPPTGLEAMSGHWIRVKLAGGQGHLAVRLSGDREELYRLPEVGR